MARINQNYAKLSAGYLFPEIARRTREFQEKNPEVKIFRLGIGNTTEPITPHVLEGLKYGVEKLGKVGTYTGYGDEQGDKRLREAVASLYSERGIKIDPSEVFISDGAKPDTANIQSIFALDNTVAVQDPSYPVYVDTNVIAGRTGEFNKENMQYEGLIYMPCNGKNGFVPDVPEKVEGDADNRAVTFPDLVYLCSPNNPTGAVIGKKRLEEFVTAAKRNRSVIIFDAAYNWFIRDQNLPKSIYEIDGAQESAIEINSFSKLLGFTGVRLGWTVVPKKLVTGDSEPGKLNSLWNRRQTTFFNGASNIAQEGGLYSLSPQGRKESQGLVDFYMENAGIIKSGLESLGITVLGGVNAPYLWMKNPNAIKSWDFFDKMMNEAHVVTTPGVGFGPAGEGFTRLSAFGHRENVQEAVESIKHNLKI